MVNYSAFVDSIDSIFTIKGIEKMPTVRVKPIEASDTNIARKKYLEFDGEEQRAMMQVMLAYKDQIIVRRLNLKPMF